MLKPNEKVLDAIVRLSNTEDFAVFCKWLTDSFYREAVESTKVDKEPQRSWMQGKTQQLEHILQTVERSRAMLDAVKGGDGDA